MDFRHGIEEYLNREIETIKALDMDSINAALNLLLETRDKGGTVYVFGNGGSSATASHFQNDFNKSVSGQDLKRFDFRCLNDNIPTLMAVANDIGFEEVFRFQLQGHLCSNDVVIAISSSGNSKNVINAVEYAKSHGAKIIGLTGYSGGELKKLSDISLHVPVENTQITEDNHLILDHLMTSLIREVRFR